MELGDWIRRCRSLHREALSWILSARWPEAVVLAMGSKLRLLLMGQLLMRPSRLRAAVTTEAEILASVRLHQPQLLFCSDWLESGSIVSCCQSALQEVPGMRVIMILSSRQRLPELVAIEPLLDAIVLEEDLGGDETPLRSAFIALARGRRYRSPSLREPDKSPELLPQASGGERLTPREEEILSLISQGLSDRQIAAALGLSHETARTYVKTVRRKLGGGTRLAAAASHWSR